MYGAEDDALRKQPVSKGFTKVETLSSVFNVEMVKGKTAEERKQIWQQYFSAKDTVYAVIPVSNLEGRWKCFSMRSALLPSQAVAFTFLLFMASQELTLYDSESFIMP